VKVPNGVFLSFDGLLAVAFKKNRMGQKERYDEERQFIQNKVSEY
jgi:hypothetical protein